MMAVLTTNEQAKSDAIIRGLHELLRTELRDGFKAAAEPIIEEAVNNAMSSFELAIERWAEPMQLSETINVILSDKRSKGRVGE